ncbi:MAG: hypothetical protein A3G80_02545 [Betaproteobacteria bacterium RIFCSPLOWO2_12_FULL_62_13b]|nr:MAG: hypothetical protein A3G80_02545 [Betaproteobacteria bacterium RIFCSPLOWO2_12_FULL_62_13b]
MAGAQEASTYPSRTVQLVVPYTPGTGADILSRILGPKLAERWRVGVVTENRAGATGNIGTELVAKAAPVALIATSAVSVIVNPQLPAKTFREFIDVARGQPGKLYYSSPGNGGPQHLTMELLKLETGIDLVHVPYKGSGGAIADLIAGHVQAMIISLQTAAPYVHGGKLRMLAVMSPERSPAFADIPTTKELGLPNLEVETWYGVFAPVGSPVSIVAKLNAEMNALLRQPDVRELLTKQGMVPAGGPPDRFGNLLKLELARWSRVVAAAGIKAD